MMRQAPRAVRLGRNMHFDALYEISQLRPYEARMLFKILDVINPMTNTAIVQYKHIPTSMQRDFKKSYKHLHSKGILTRLKPEKYLVNPQFYVPRRTYNAVQDHWDKVYVK